MSPFATVTERVRERGELAHGREAADAGLDRRAISLPEMVSWEPIDEPFAESVVQDFIDRATGR
jgi:hypothetical protein